MLSEISNILFISNSVIFMCAGSLWLYHEYRRFKFLYIDIE